MKHCLYIAIIIFSLQTTAQSPTSSSEIGIMVGESYYLGELNSSHFLPFNIGGGVFYRYNIDDRIAVKANLNYGTIEGADDISSNEFNLVRNFNFSSKIYEFSINGEFNFLEFSHLNEKSSPITPYGFIGLAYFYHNPKGNLNGTKVDLQTLELEGVKYKKSQLSIPLGVGIKYKAGRLGLGLDWGIRKTFTDYIDDVSSYYSSPNGSSNNSLINFQRGDLYSKDWYVFTGVTLFVNLTSKTVCRIP